MTRTIVPGLFCIDATGPESVFLGFHDPQLRWNGWATPEFDREQVERIATWVHNDAGDPDYRVEFTWDGDVLVQTNVDGGERDVQRYEPNERGRYPVGAFSWTWSVVDAPAWAELGEFLLLTGEISSAYVAASKQLNDQLAAQGFAPQVRIPRSCEAGRAASLRHLETRIQDLLRELEADPKGRAAHSDAAFLLLAAAAGILGSFVMPASPSLLARP